MAMPVDLVLVRHGESEGNVASRATKLGDDRHFDEEFRARHSSLWRLTDKGIAQARAAGVWIRDNLELPFDRYYVSEYLRAKETAAELALPGAVWYSEMYLRERDHGAFDVLPYAERRRRYADALERRKIDPFFWAPPEGESIASVCLRVDRMLDTFHRELDGKRVVVVSHGEMMWAFRCRLERLSAAEFSALDNSNDPRDELHNCQILHYSRRDPESGEIASHMCWMRSLCPWDESLSWNEWRQFGRPRYSNEDLRRQVEATPRLIADE